MADYRRVLESTPDRFPIRQRIADILFKLRRPDEAIPELEIVKQQQPEDVAVSLSLSKCYREDGRQDQATATLDSLPKSGQDDPRVRAERGLIALSLEDYAGAETLLRDALLDIPREREVLYGLQQCLAQLGKNSDAEEVQAVLREVDLDGRRMGEVINGLTRNPDDADLRFEGACIFLRNGVQEDGKRWLEMTLTANPRHIEAHQRMAEILEKEGSRDGAAAHREFVRQLTMAQSQEGSSSTKVAP